MYEYNAEIIRVIDGDTIEVNIDLGFCFWAKKQIVRLLGVDAPEIRSKDKEEVKFGKLSKNFVEKFCQTCGGRIIIQTELEDVISGKEKFGRILAIVKNPETKEILNEQLVKNYLAVYYSGENKDCVRASHLENREKFIQLEFEFKGEF